MYFALNTPFFIILTQNVYIYIIMIQVIVYNYIQLHDIQLQATCAIKKSGKLTSNSIRNIFC
jgi:hypothetical protein